MHLPLHCREGGTGARLHVDEGEELLEELADEEGGAVVGAQRRQQPVQHGQDVAPVRAQLAGRRQRRACGSERKVCLRIQGLQAAMGCYPDSLS